jgi:hypothetical protein
MQVKIYAACFCRFIAVHNVPYNQNRPQRQGRAKSNSLSNVQHRENPSFTVLRSSDFVSLCSLLRASPMSRPAVHFATKMVQRPYMSVEHFEAGAFSAYRPCRSVSDAISLSVLCSLEEACTSVLLTWVVDLCVHTTGLCMQQRKQRIRKIY